MKEIDAYIDAASALIDLKIAPEWQPGVRSYLLLAEEMAALLEAAPLDEDEFALAPVFMPPEVKT